MKSKKMLLLVLLCFFELQSQTLEKAQSYFDRGDFYNCKVCLLNLKTSSYNDKDQARFYYLLGMTNSSLNAGKEAISAFIRSRQLYESLKMPDKMNEVNLEIVGLIQTLEGKSALYRKYLEEYQAYALKKGDPMNFVKLYKQMGNGAVEDFPAKGIRLYRKALSYNARAKDSMLESNIWCNMAIVYSDKLKRPDSSEYCLKTALRYLPKKNSANMRCNILINQSSLYRAKREYKSALAKLLEAKDTELPEFQRKTRLIIFWNLAEVYDSIHDYEKALLYKSKYIEASENLGELSQTLDINNLINQLAVKEREADNFRLKIMNYSIACALTSLVIISLITYKNINRKKKLAEQEKIIETQRLENKINEQELQHIDKMLETQEKERQRIADELHDDLGSMLATLKMNFQHLEQRQDLPSTDQQWLERTDELIDLTYQKVRNISHLKNLGVAANEGLLKSINRMADKMTISGSFQVNAIPFGLTNRLENTTEVTLFRIIMELCTNVMKHASATEINIYLNQHDNESLNILIEDNGKGFDVSEIMRKDGIGLKNMEKKIEQLGGTFTIDSNIGIGTTIIIDLVI